MKHRSHRRRPQLLIAFGLLFAAACGGGTEETPDGAACSAGTGRYLPMVTGASWTYDTNEEGIIEVKTQTVGAIEDVGGMKAGTQAFRVTTSKVAGMVVSWQEDTGSAILRHRELDMSGGTHTDETYLPAKLRIDEDPARLTVNASYTETYTEEVTDTMTNETSSTDKSETWTVLAVDEEVTVPAGTFCAMKLRKQSTGATGSSDKMYWFARGIGKVKEESTGRSELLTAYSIP